MRRKFTIPREKLPTQLYSVTLVEPLYEDYRLARKRYPVPRFEGDESHKVPYAVEELLLAMCMEAIDDKPLPSNPRDMADRLEPFPIQDRQYLMAVFTSMFYLSRDQAQAARNYADKERALYKQGYTIPSHLFPSGRTVSLRTPNTGVQMAADRKYQSSGQIYSGYAVNLGCSFEEFLSASCIDEIDGQKVELPKDVISVFNTWEIADVQLYSTLFINLFTIDESARDDAKKLAAELKEQFLVPTTEEPKARSRKSEPII